MNTSNLEIMSSKMINLEKEYRKKLQQIFTNSQRSAFFKNLHFKVNLMSLLTISKIQHKATYQTTTFENEFTIA